VLIYCPDRFERFSSLTLSVWTERGRLSAVKNLSAYDGLCWYQKWKLSKYTRDNYSNLWAFTMIYHKARPHTLEKKKMRLESE